MAYRDRKALVAFPVKRRGEDDPDNPQRSRKSVLSLSSKLILKFQLHYGVCLTFQSACPASTRSNLQITFAHFHSPVLYFSLPLPSPCIQTGHGWLALCTEKQKWRIRSSNTKWKTHNQILLPSKVHCSKSTIKLHKKLEDYLESA